MDAAAIRRHAAWLPATLRTSVTAARMGTEGGSSRLNVIPTLAPLRVVSTRVSAAISWPPVPRMSMALIAVFSRWSPRRWSAASSSARATAAARLHQVRPTHDDSVTATGTPVSTAPTRTTPMWKLADAHA